MEVFVTFLTAPQLQRMHETEGAYLLNRLHGLTLHLGLSLEGFRWGTGAWLGFICCYTTQDADKQSITIAACVHQGCLASKYSSNVFTCTLRSSHFRGL